MKHGTAPDPRPLPSEHTRDRRQRSRSRSAARLLLPLPLAFVLAAFSCSTGDPDGPGTPAVVAPDVGLPGAGDPYFADYGSSGYDAQRYEVEVSWDPGTEVLTGRAVITAQAAHDLTSFWFDLALPVNQVRVDGVAATFQRSRFQDVRVDPARPVSAGDVFTVSVEYAGTPASLSLNGTTAWRTSNEEWTAAGEPESAAWWFPSNDHPSDPAEMAVSVRVPSGFQALSVGRLVSRDAEKEASFDTWRWVAEQPLPTYASFVAIGRYEIREGATSGRPYVYAVSRQIPAAEREQTFDQLEKSNEIVPALESMFGPYPFDAVGGVVTATRLPFRALETQARPLYERDALVDDASATRLIVHELTHMWFGNHVTLHGWGDIFLSEGYATWAQWGYAERQGGNRADSEMRVLFDRYAGDDNFWRTNLVDPGPGHLFSSVYSRGPMALQALRNVIGEEAFSTLARDWARDPGPRTVEDWMAVAQSKTDVDLAAFFWAWFYSPTKPDQTPSNGFV